MNQSKIKKLEWISQEIISQAIMQEIDEIQQDFGLINITWVKISSDLSYIDVYISSFKNEEILAKTIAKHNQNIQTKYHKSLAIRKIPKIRYRYDKKWQIGQEVCNILNSIK